MTTTFIDTTTLARVHSEAGDFTEVLNNELVGAENVVGTVRWLSDGQTYEAAASDKHQLVYLMDGNGSIHLEGKDYDVKKGGGVYLKPEEGARITAKGGDLKLFQLVVRQVPVN